MKLRTVLDGLCVREADEREAAEIARDAGQEQDDEVKFFVVQADAFRGYASRA